MPNLHQPKPFLIITAITLATLLALIPHRAYACSCVPIGTPTEELEYMGSVFSGKATDMQLASSNADLLTPLQVTFEVFQVWKGPVSRTLTVKALVCAYSFEIGQEYLVYAHAIDENVIKGMEAQEIQFDIAEGDLISSICTRTKPLANATEDLAALGAGTPITPESPPQPPSPLAWLSPLRIDDATAPLTCVPPVALIGVLSALPIGARLKTSLRRRSK